MILVDAKLGALEQAGVIGEALGEIDLDGIEVPDGGRGVPRDGARRGEAADQVAATRRVK